MKRAQEKGIAKVCVHDLRTYSTNKHRATDDYAFGGGAGMVMMIEPIDNCISQLKSDGEVFSQAIANELSLKKNLILLCGHYKGVDERVREHLITREISIGNYVLSGGELAAAVISDGIIRLIPGVLSDESSALTDSFQDGLVAPPVYTRPAEYKGWRVPEVLISGHEGKISEWRHNKSLERTKKRRPGMLSD